MYKYIVLSTVVLTTACTTNDAGKKVIDYEAVALATKLTCALAPTAAQILQLYTDNKSVTTTTQAVALLCAALLPIAKVPATVPEIKK